MLFFQIHSPWNTTLVCSHLLSAYSQLVLIKQSYLFFSTYIRRRNYFWFLQAYIYEGGRTKQWMILRAHQINTDNCPPMHKKVSPKLVFLNRLLTLYSIPQTFPNRILMTIRRYTEPKQASFLLFPNKW